jgi:nitroimidazol reductase NimA-like FMN-containing flavoprotein (pyridoxamine 5'-phosphate oxidase superfamily)
MDTLLTDRTRLRRLPDRGRHDRDAIDAILDAGFICHVGFVADAQPFVIPTGYARAGDRLYIHGSSASRMVQNLAQGLAVCVTVTLVDGLVLARSAFHHSVNYRSVVVLGQARLVVDADEKMEALRLFTNHLVAGRFEEARRPTGQELKGTAVLELGLTEASAKIRSGPPLDDEEDMGVEVWAGVIPLATTVGTPVADRGLPAERQIDVGRVLFRRRGAADQGHAAKDTMT